MKIVTPILIAAAVVVVLTFVMKAIDEKRAANGKKFIFNPNV